MQKCCREVLCRSVGEKCCREVLVRLCFCGGVVVFLWLCGSGCNSVVEILWWCLRGGVVLWWCCGVCVVAFLCFLWLFVVVCCVFAFL